MSLRLSITVLITRICDFIGATLLGLYAFLVVGPLGFLRGPLVLERAMWYLRVFIPMGLMAKAVRVAIDWRLGHFDVAIAQAEEVIALVEQYYQKNPQSQVRRRVLGDLYTILTRAYMHAGHIDEAMQVVLRAKKCMGVDRLVGLADLDAKTAHLVRAGLAAGRLLDGGGLATMFVKSDAQPAKTPQSSCADAANQSGNDPDKHQSTDGAKIIPFPSSE
ncbi:MAG: hypothetical protein HRU09_08080 [Oligoflexales bacterium]|nr:hypothetical protein [Oligoflexales bacterium]